MTGQSSEPVLTRRHALRGAAVGATLVWVAPAVQVVAMGSANAASGPPEKVRGPDKPKDKPKDKTKPAG
jgi:hypothetical protein